MADHEEAELAALAALEQAAGAIAEIVCSPDGPDVDATITVYTKDEQGNTVSKKVSESAFFANYWHGEYQIPPVNKKSISYTNVADKRKKPTFPNELKARNRKWNGS